jgi:hypothetical protein
MNLPLNVRINLLLLPIAEVRFPVPPAQPSKPGSFGAVSVFQVPKDGLYRVSSKAGVWLDVVDLAAVRLLPPTWWGHTKLPHSDLHKCVIYRLKGGVRYALEFARAATPGTSVLLTPDSQ